MIKTQYYITKLHTGVHKSGLNAVEIVLYDLNLVLCNQEGFINAV